jgi:putative transferase (TIGR04331 family)
MFLIKTAEPRFWKSGVKILFLGGWCKTYANRSAWKDTDYEMIPYHWDDRKQLYHDFRYLEGVYEEYLYILSEKMNIIHGVNHSFRYWRIILGPWLNYFIAMVFDRFITLKTACKLYPMLETVISDTAIENLIPDSMLDCSIKYSRDAYNEVIYSEIIKEVDLCANIKRQPAKYSFADKKIIKNKPSFFEIVKLFLNKVNRYRNPSFVFVNPYFSILDQLKLQLRLGQLPAIFFSTPLKLQDLSCQSDKRAMLCLRNGKSQFGRLLDTLIPKQIPKVHLEYYFAIKKLARKRFSNKAKVINTATAHIMDEVFKVWAAGMIDKGTKLTVTQHGGHYGTGLWSWSEDHQSAISDYFITWGWGNEKGSKYYALSSGKLMKAKRLLKPKDDGNILLVLNSAPRYSYWMHSMPVAYQLNYYFDNQVILSSCLNGQARKLLKIRFYPHDYNWGEQEKIQKLGRNIQKTKPELTMTKQLNNSRLFIGTYNATTFLETFAANFPTILFWDPHYWEIRLEAQAYFDDLRSAGILHDTPESAASMINNIYNDPASWWEQDEVQEAKDKFCEQFALTSSNYLSEWRKFFIRSKIRNTKVISNV